MTVQRTHIVVIGGGYAGTLAANHLRLNADVDITMVNPRPVFVERIRLHQLAAGSGSAAVDYGTLLGEGVRLRVDNAERIDTAARTVELDVRRAAGLRLPDLCRRQHRRCPGRGARRSRIRLPDR